jgi:hypothetical protein
MPRIEAWVPSKYVELYCSFVAHLLVSVTVQLQRPEYIFGVVALLLAFGIAWFFVDSPKAIGVGILGSVEYCKTIVVTKETLPTSCQVYIPGQDKRVLVYMPSAPPGNKIRLMVMRRAISGTRYYVVDYATKP